MAHPDRARARNCAPPYGPRVRTARAASCPMKRRILTRLRSTVGSFPSLPVSSDHLRNSAVFLTLPSHGLATTLPHSGDSRKAGTEISRFLACTKRCVPAGTKMLKSPEGEPALKLTRRYVSAPMATIMTANATRMGRRRRDLGAFSEAGSGAAGVIC